MRRIFAWQTDGAGCYHYRLHLPLTHLPADRFSYVCGAPGPDIFDYDVVIGQRLAGHNDLWDRLCADPSILAVYDIDDDLLNIDPENVIPHSIYAPLVEGTTLNIMQADVVTASTPKLAEYLSRINPNVIVLRNYVHPALPETPRRVRHGLMIGWGGSMFHAQDWGGVNDILVAVRRRFPWIGFRSVGANYMTGTNVSTAGFTDVNTYHTELDFHIGIAPLNRTPFNERKSWIKVLEYAARGIPCVASDVGQYPEWVNHAGNGFIARYPSEWVDYLEALVDDDERTRMGEAALAQARENTIDRHIHEWVEVYDR